MTEPNIIELKWYQKLRWRQTSHPEAVHAERQLLNLSKTTLETTDVALGPSPEHYMHTITGGHENNSSPPMVYIPGYGAGAAFMFRAFDGFTSAFRSYFVDLLGTGLSGRPEFPITDGPTNTPEAEAFFVESLAQWRQKQGIDKMVLVGHSLGGYLSAVYALKHPEHVEHLILVCPAGVNKKPDNWEVPKPLLSPWSLRGQIFRLATRGWDKNYTPGTLVRGLGPLGPGLVGKYTSNRFKQGHALTEEEVVLFKDYMYHILAAQGSGEFALRHLLGPFAWARAPLEERLQDLKVPVTFIYGEHDWMDMKAGGRVCATLTAARKVEPLQSAPASDCKLIITPNAGHYPFVDQPGIFLTQILDTCKSYLPVEAQKRMKEQISLLPYSTLPASDTVEELKEEMARDPVEAEAHIATDL